MWHNNISVILYINKDPIVERREVQRPTGPITIHKMSFFGTNKIYAGQRKDMNIGIWVEMWSNEYPWQMNCLNPSGSTMVIVEGQLLSRPDHNITRTDGKPTNFHFIRARTVKPLNTAPARNPDPEIIYIRKSSFQHMARWAKQHGYSPISQIRVNKGGQRNPLPQNQDEDDTDL